LFAMFVSALSSVDAVHRSVKPGRQPETDSSFSAAAMKGDTGNALCV